MSTLADGEVRELLGFGEHNGMPGELVVRIDSTKVIASLDMTA